jgi:transcriptional regulator with XRE-family HTH domain
VDLTTKVAKYLLKYRKISGLSQEKLADLSNVHRTYISQIERGLKSPTLETIFKICGALDIKTSLFVKEIEDEF